MMLTSACERNAGGKAQLSIQFPEVTAADAAEKVTTLVSNSSDEWADITPTGLSGAYPINCFGVYVLGPEDSLKVNSCGVKDFTTPMKKFGPWQGGVPAGRSLTFEIEAGKDRVVGVFGFHATDMAACKDFTGTKDMDKSKLSKPYFIGESSPQVFAPGSTVNVPVSLAFSSSGQFEDCKGPGFPNSGSGGGSGNGDHSINVGNGSDGDFVVATSLTDVRSFNSVSKGVPLITTTRVMGLSAIAGNLRQLNISTMSNLDGKFVVGDEVALYIAAASSSLGCGTNLSPGFRTRGIVNDLSGLAMSITVDDERFASIPTSKLGALAGGTPRDFCRMVVTRVPHFNKLTFNGGFLSYNAASFGDMGGSEDHEAGIMIIRVKDRVEVQSGGGIDVAARGFKGGCSSCDVDGQSTLGSTLKSPLDALGTPNGNGGSGATSGGYPGGGGHGGAGGNGYNDLVGLGGLDVGDEYGCGSAVPDPQKKCLFGKIFFGGGGGAGYDGKGGDGGGIIILNANTIQLNSGSLVFNADGGSSYGGSTGGGAGGAGGAVLINTRTLNGGPGGSLKLRAHGGFSKVSSSFGFGKGGSGGGGRNHLNITQACSVVGPSLAMEAYGPSEYVANIGKAGGAGTNFITGSGAAGCASNVAMNQSPAIMNISPSYISENPGLGTTFTVYGESFSGADSAALIDLSNNVTYPCDSPIFEPTAFDCNTQAVQGSYQLIIQGSTGHRGLGTVNIMGP